MNAPLTPPRPADVLVVEDTPEVSEVVRRVLTAAGFTVHQAADGEAGLNAALDTRPDLVILDVGLPKRSGFEVAQELRRRAFRAPVLMLTARGTVSDKITGLDAGADDYLAKPFDAEELVARVRALIRRSTLSADSARLTVGDLTLDPMTRTVARGGREISLTQKEYALLEYLMRNAGRPVSRQMIAEHVWKQPFDPTTNIVDVYINYLRRKIDADSGPELLHTVRGVGYVLKEP